MQYDFARMHASVRALVQLQACLFEYVYACIHACVKACLQSLTYKHPCLYVHNFVLQQRAR